MKLHVRGSFLATAGALLIVGVVLLMDLSPSPYTSHQPVLLSQMERMVTPGNPAVMGTLHTLLGDSVYDAADIPRTVNDFAALREWINHIEYVSDEENHGVNDYWQTPAETIALASGDCEDIAILFVSLLRAYGVPAGEAYVGVGYADYDNWHAFVFEKCYMGVWRALDPERGTSATLLSQGLAYKIAYCFNDREATRRFAIPEPDRATVLCAATMYPWDRGASNVFRRELAAGQRVEAAVQWLVPQTDAGYWVDVYYPWSISIYDAGGTLLSSWSGTEAGHALEFTAETAGTYYLEVLKRDSEGRYFRLAATPEGWEPEPANGFKPGGDTIYEIDGLRPYWPAELVRIVKSPPPGELVDYTLGLLNRERQAARERTVTLYPSGSAVLAAPSPLTLGSNSAAQAHAEDMLEKQYLALWDSNGLMPSINHFLAGGRYFSEETVYFTGVKWDGPKDDSYLRYIERLLDGAVAALRGSGGDLYYLTSPYNSAVDIGLAFDDHYLFLVLDYEYAPGAVFSSEPDIRAGIVTLSGQLAAGMGLAATIQVHYFRPPQALTPSQLNGTGIDYLAISSGAWVASVGQQGPYSDAFQFMNVDLPVLSDPLDSPGGSTPGLDARGNTLEAMESGLSASVIFRTGADTWRVQDGRFYIIVDLRKIISAFGPGVYTLEMACSLPPVITGSSINYYVLYTYTSYSFFLG